MTKFVNIVYRYVAPFGYGFCMAGVFSAEDFGAMATMILLGYVFATLSMNVGRRTLDQELTRISHMLFERRVSLAE